MGNNSKKRNNFRWAVTIGLLIGTVCVVAFAFIYKLPKIYKYDSDTAVSQTDQPDKSFLATAEYKNSSDSPLIKTDFDKIFFSPDKEGKIEYYRYAKKKFVKIKPSDTVKVTLSKGKEKALVTIYIIENNGTKEGYGAYVNPESTLFPYAFVKLTENNITKDNFNYLLYVDYSIDDYYRNDKDFSTLYALSTKDNMLKKVISDKGAPARQNCTEDNFVLIPDSLTTAGSDAFYFLSDRSYEPGEAFDLYRKDSVSGKEDIVCEGISSPYLPVINNQLHFFKTSQDKTEFYFCKMTDNGPTTVQTFSGDTGKYKIKGSYMFNAATKTLYNLKDSKKKSFQTSISINGVQDFDVSKDGSKIAIAGNFAGNSEKLLFADFKAKKLNIIDSTNLFLSDYSNICFIDDSVYFLSPSEEDGKISNLVFSWDAIFSYH